VDDEFVRVWIFVKGSISITKEKGAIEQARGWRYHPLQFKLAVTPKGFTSR
jgi:hypothetical protein